MLRLGRSRTRGRGQTRGSLHHQHAAPHRRAVLRSEQDIDARGLRGVRLPGVARGPAEIAVHPGQRRRDPLLHPLHALLVDGLQVRFKGPGKQRKRRAGKGGDKASRRPTPSPPEFRTGR
jgi:hypothetical protein